MNKSSSMVTFAGLLSTLGIGFVGIPLLTITAYANVIKDGPPHWFIPVIFPMMLFGFVLAAIGHALGGVAGKGVDDVPTIPQVQSATLKAVADEAVSETEAKPSEMPAVPVTIVPSKD